MKFIYFIYFKTLRIPATQQTYAMKRIYHQFIRGEISAQQAIFQGTQLESAEDKQKCVNEDRKGCAELC